MESQYLLYHTSGTHFEIFIYNFCLFLLAVMFRLYDADSNGVLDKVETDAIVNQMMSVAEYLGWDVSELKPVCKKM